RVGGGRVVMWASTFDNLWNDLPVQPVFLPLVQQLAKYTSGYAEERPWHTVGEALALSPPRARAGAEVQGAAAPPAAVVAVAPSGERIRPANAGAGGSVELSEQGFYEVRPLEQSGGPAPRAVAVNLDVSESDLTAMDPDELAVAVGGAPAAASAAPNVAVAAEDRERRQHFWWFLLAAALLLLAAETVVSNRLSRATR
ncbi:MAG: hypothetical protein ACREON_06245, partial [Gemmatimonadaceae bacterium]